MSDDLVYSTEKGDLRRKDKNKKSGNKNNSSLPAGIKNDGIIRIKREKKGRAGKTVTAVYGVPLKGIELSLLAKTLKQKCGTGGSVKDNVIIIQGDTVEKVIAVLAGEGYKAKKAGG